MVEDEDGGAWCICMLNMCILDMDIYTCICV